MHTEPYEKWSPFDPAWYKDAFDKHIATADQIFNQNEIIEAGYYLPDSDGSKSSVFRRDAVLNNSFNEKVLKDTLAEIYLNNSHRLTASNHDNVHFYQWHIKMEDMELIPNTVLCQYVIPVESFIDQKTRDRFKLSQFYRNWVSITDIMNNWDTFGWHCLLFINQRIYSDYEFRIDEQQVTVRFRYEQFWLDRNYTIDIYKFDTKASCRIGITRQLVVNQWNWKLPVYYFTDERVQNNDKMILTFNRLRDPALRFDGIDADIMGDNLEFVTVEDGLIDLNKISAFNKKLILSEESAWMWLGSFVPRFLHEYPIPLPVDIIYRPYQTEFIPVMAENDAEHHNVKTHIDINLVPGYRIFVNLKDDDDEWNDGWRQLIRPIVLSDAFKANQPSPYSAVDDDLNELERLTVAAADVIEKFRTFMGSYTTDRKFLEYCDQLEESLKAVYDTYTQFLTDRRIDLDQDYIDRYNGFVDLMPEIREEKSYSVWFHKSHGKKNDFWSYVSPLVYIPRALADKFYISTVLNDLGNATLWEEDHPDQVRFNRPVDATDFWTFEYDKDNMVWRPFVLDVEHHFPDVYTVSDPAEEIPTENRIFKAFFFYSDTMNVLNESVDMVEATPSWGTDVDAFESKNAIYRDVFMEKFYWMGIKSIYKGLIITDFRWEVIEYIQDNTAYTRFNDLFLNTMDPYFKMGLATYLRSANYMFPFDDAIAKMKEAMTSKFIGYNKITNFEAYLNNSWIPSYFDNITRIMDDWSGENKLIRRPRNSFDTTRFLPTLIDVQTSISNEVNTLNNQIDWIMEQLGVETYGVDTDIIATLRKLTTDIEDNMNAVLEFTNSLDMEIYSIDDVNHITAMLAHHIELLSDIGDQFRRIYQDAYRNKVYEEKQSIVNNLKVAVAGLKDNIDTIWAAMKTFDMDAFMKALNDPAYFDKKDHTGDESLIGIINNFFDTWPDEVKEARNELFVSSTSLWSKYDTTHQYTTQEIDDFNGLVLKVHDDIIALSDALYDWWDSKGVTYDDNIVNHIDYCINAITILFSNMNDYVYARDAIIESSDNIRAIMVGATAYRLSDTELTYISSIDGLLTLILENVSYIGSTGSIDQALINYNTCKTTVELWLTYLDHEQLVFEKIFEMSEQPNHFLETMDEYDDILHAMMEYMDTVNREFIPDDYWPTYSDVYEVETIQLVTGGYNNNVGDKAFFRGVGSFKINAVAGSVNQATELELLDYRTTVFRDPCIQSLNPYDSITDGNGMGIAIKAIGSKKTLIINDEVISPYIAKCKKICSLVRLNLDVINPYTNVAIDDDVARLRKINTDWVHLNSFYHDYMSEDAHMAADHIIDDTVRLIPELEDLNEIRSRNDLSVILVDYEKFIKASYATFEAMGQITPNYLYFDGRLRVAYQHGLNYFGNGSTWNDREGLTEVLNEMLYELNLFNRKVLVDLPEDSDVRQMYEDLKALIELNPSVLAEFDAKVDIIVPILDEIDSCIDNMPELRRDIWYNLKQIGVGYSGEGYKVGDIVEIIPELPTDSAGNVIHDKEDIILNDVILCQVTQVTDGVVTAVEPLMSYALPYQLFGSRRTITRVGTGEGLILNIYSVEIGLKDSKMFRDPSSDEDKLPQYDENDLFTFKFDNIHDLDITYEVFFAGKQVRDFIVRHETSDDPLHPRQFDVIYLNANDVMELANSSVYQEGENYFVYKIDDVKIIDPGAGYTKGQEIIVETDQVALRLQVISLMDTPYNQIEEIGTVTGNVLFDDVDPTSDNATAVTDSLNNIDDEYNSGYYDQLPRYGILKPATRELPADEYPFYSRRFDDLSGKNRNEVWMHPDVDLPEGDDVPREGDPDYHWYLGARYNDVRRWNSIANVVDPADNVVPDENRLPTDQTWTGEYQMIERAWIHDSGERPNDTNVLSSTTVGGEEVTPVDFSELPHLNHTLSAPLVYTDERIVNEVMEKGDLTVDTYANLPRHMNEWPNAVPGKYVVVETDETQNNHRTIYRLRTFTVTGYFIYDEPEYADYKWDYFDIDWMKTNYYPDLPCTKQQYPSTIWRTAETYRAVQEAIQDGNIERKFSPELYPGTYIANLTVDDLSVYNYTTQSWEDLHDASRWELVVRNDDENKNWGFRLTFKESGNYSYDMRLYLNKVPSTQLKNAELKRNAVFKINASIHSEVDTPTINTSVNTGRSLRIRKLFPYEQKEEYTISEDLGYKMNFKLANYTHFKNELHLEDVKIFNKTANRFEDLMDTNMFEVRFKDPKAVQRGYEKQKIIAQSIISGAGEGFVDGEVWAWNTEQKIHVFGKVTSDFLNDGHILTFTPIHCPNPPEEDVTLEFKVYQHATQNTSQAATVIIEFKTQEVEVWGDGYIHNVTNPMAPLPEEFQIICQYDLDQPTEYEVGIIKSAHTWVFVEPDWIVFPVFHLDGYSVPADRIYIMTSKGRFPLINPSTGKPSMYVYQTDTGTDVKFLNIYNKYEHFEIHSTPYPMRSVYTKRRVPSHGYIDLEGKLNKPLNKKYFEFWMNGRLLDDEVTIISPTKLFLHGLKSLRNFEIIEINRDQVEYFSDDFLSVVEPEYGRPYPIWDYNTYLDDALSGTLEGDNYSTTEQEALLAPVWHQVDRDNPEYKNYPPNQDVEEDILLRVDDYVDMSQAEAMPYQFAVINVPSIESVPISGRTLGFDDFGFIPMSNATIVDMLNDEWKEEIESGELDTHTVVSDDEWYGVAARLYDEFGILVHTLDESAYYVTDDTMLEISQSTRLSRIVKKNVIYDLD